MKIPTGARPLDFLFILRPMILVPVWTFFLLGAWHGRSSGAEAAGPSRLLPGLASFTALLGGIYILNQIADRETDRAAGKLFLLSHGIVPVWAAWTEAAALVACAFVVAALAMPLAFIVILGISLLLGILYSLEPARFKRRPALDVLSNAVGNGALNTLAGWTAAGCRLQHWEALIPYPLAVASVHLATTLADIDADAKAGLRTSGVALGTRRGLLVSMLLMGGAAAIAWPLGSIPAFAASLLSLPLFLVPAREPRWKAGGPNVLLPAKGATLVFSVAAGFLFPVYIPALAAVILLTRLYYRRRFDLEYPSLR